MSAKTARKIKPVPTAEKLIDLAFKKASRQSAPVPRTLPALLKAKRREETRVKTAYQVVNSKLLSIVKDFPSFDNIHPFYRDLINTFYNINDIRKALGSLSGSSAIILSLMRRYINKIRSCNTPREAQKLRKSAFGRLASIVKKLDDRLHYLEDVRVILNHLPGIDPNLPTVVVAGAPNVGKSSLVKAISTAEPEVAEYPFTTRDIIVGKFKHNHIEVQVIDTPGILDRPIEKRNKSEIINKIDFLCNKPIQLILSLINGILKINNEIRQIGNTKDMIFSIDEIIAYISQFVSLKMGDLIYTGTPAGVGPVKIGDQLEAFIEAETMLKCKIK